MTKTAAEKLFSKTTYKPEDVHVVELHDCFSANELITYEALGLCEPGKAGDFIDSGNNTYGGRVVVNPSGGLISKGHPLGATVHPRLNDGTPDEHGGNNHSVTGSPLASCVAVPSASIPPDEHGGYNHSVTGSPLASCVAVPSASYHLTFTINTMFNVPWIEYNTSTPPATKVRCMTYPIQAADVPVQLTTTDLVITIKWSTRFELCATRLHSPLPGRCTKSINCAGLAQCSELCWQLRGLADKRQVPGAKLALQHNIGLGGAAVVTLYKLGFPHAHANK
uniref:Thiolase C-terminal domain-containing protein n=1 Tax=Timema bartmani TaxID=61472 RepID=A0A7R9I8G4_9NEOP|nr:unnamed protein product [Timema bartmani]